MGSLAEQVLTLNSTLEAIEVRFAQGEVPVEGLEALKSSVDDFRLRVWGVLAAASADDYRSFQERFRIRRAKEICRGVGSDLRAGKMSGVHSELPELAEAAGLLTRSINLARRQSALDGSEGQD
jgi:hypothetical protein